MIKIDMYMALSKEELLTLAKEIRKSLSHYQKEDVSLSLPSDKTLELQDMESTVVDLITYETELYGQFNEDKVEIRQKFKDCYTKVTGYIFE